MKYTARKQRSHPPSGSTSTKSLVSLGYLEDFITFHCKALPRFYPLPHLPSHNGKERFISKPGHIFGSLGATHAVLCKETFQVPEDGTVILLLFTRTLPSPRETRRLWMCMRTESFQCTCLTTSLHGQRCVSRRGNIGKNTHIERKLSIS